MLLRVVPVMLPDTAIKVRVSILEFNVIVIIIIQTIMYVVFASSIQLVRF